MSATPGASDVHLPRSFRRTDGDVTIGGCALAQLAAEFGTPLQVLDGADVDARAVEYVDNDPARLKGLAWLIFNLDEFLYVR